EMEFNGVRLDVETLRRLSAEMGGQLAVIEKEIYELAGHPFNIGSLPQLRKVLFEELKLPVQGRTGVTGAPSTDQETLEKLAALGAPDRGLLADRAAPPGALLPGRRAVPGLRRGPRRPRGGRLADLPRPRGPGQPRPAAHGQDGQLRRRLRHQPGGAGAAAG